MADVKFPRLHIAESVVNRILNVRDELRAGKIAPPSIPSVTQPAVPDPTIAGAQIDSQVTESVPPLEEAPEVVPIAQGTDLIEQL